MKSCQYPTRVEFELKAIEKILSDLKCENELLIEKWETLPVPVSAEKSLMDFLEIEPHVYSGKDFKVKIH